MLTCKESDGTLQRTITMTIKPTATEVADAIWNLDSDEQIVLLGCLKRRVCNSEKGLIQLAFIANTLDTMSNERSDEVKDFVRLLADYVLGEQRLREKCSDCAGKRTC